MAETRDITVAPVNDVPDVTTTVADLAYTENDSAIAIDTGLTVTDLDDTNLASATIQITNNYTTGEDVLAFSTQLGITGSFNATNGMLTLTGTTTVANYQTALRAVTYTNTSDDPSGATRTVTFLTTDTTAGVSVAETRDITVAPVNDVPDVTTTVADLTYTENDGAIAIDTGLTGHRLG